MSIQDVAEKYRNFVNDYNSGMSRKELCEKYSLSEEDFDAFLSFLKRKGYRLSRNPIKTFMTAHDIDYEIHGDDMQFVVIELDP